MQDTWPAGWSPALPECGHSFRVAGPVDVFGHSGGAQLAHRFAMLNPHRVERLSLAAAGWYCLPDASMAYPYGLGIDEDPASLRWARRHEQALSAYLSLPVQVFIGPEDSLRDNTLHPPSAGPPSRSDTDCEGSDLCRTVPQSGAGQRDHPRDHPDAPARHRS